MMVPGAGLEPARSKERGILNTVKIVSFSLWQYHLVYIYVNKISRLTPYSQKKYHLVYGNLHHIWLLYGYYFGE